MLLQKKPEIYDTHRLLRNISASWNEIGFQLHVNDNFRNILKHNSDTSGEKLEQILKEWDRTECSDVTWRTVIKVLTNLEENGVARIVQEYLNTSEAVKKYIDQKDFVKFQPII